MAPPATRRASLASSAATAAAAAAALAIGLPGVVAQGTLPAEAIVEQAGARIPAGGDLSFYVVGSSTAAWQSWPDQLHAMLLRLGYAAASPATSLPGEIVRPDSAPVCQDADTYSELETPRFGMIGWSSWGFAFDSKDDCNDEGYRNIAGFEVSCTNGWACNPEWTGIAPLVPVSSLASALAGAHVVVMANWINDFKAWQDTSARETCYLGADVGDSGSVDITIANLKRTIQAVHAENPDAVILVLARYPDTQEIIYVNERTLSMVAALNAAVKERIASEPNTYFVDYEFPLRENMFQTLKRVHPNCRGDKVIATSIIDAMYQHKVLSKSLALSPASECPNESSCAALTLPCCQRSALCYVAADGACATYSPGLQA